MISDIKHSVTTAYESVHKLCFIITFNIFCQWTYLFEAESDATAASNQARKQG